MDANQIQKYKKYGIPKLRKKAGDIFRAWIRKRDEGQPCISCGAPNPSDAGHFHPAGKVSALEFNEDNCHAQCRSCNYYKSADLHNYRKHLIRKIGLERVEKLDEIADRSKREVYKHNRFFLIETILKYK